MNWFDLGFCGLSHTYDNKRAGAANVKVRLDRCVANMYWRNLFPSVQVVHLVSARSDHCLVCLKGEVLMVV